MKIKFGKNFFISLFFFGLAGVQAFQAKNNINEGNWLNVVFLAAIAIVFLLSDMKKK